MKPDERLRRIRIIYDIMRELERCGMTEAVARWQERLDELEASCCESNSVKTA